MNPLLINIAVFLLVSFQLVNLSRHIYQNEFNTSFPPRIKNACRFVNLLTCFTLLQLLFTFFILLIIYLFFVFITKLTLTHSSRLCLSYFLQSIFFYSHSFVDRSTMLPLNLIHLSITYHCAQVLILYFLVTSTGQTSFLGVETEPYLYQHPISCSIYVCCLNDSISSAFTTGY